MKPNTRFASPRASTFRVLASPPAAEATTPRLVNDTSSPPYTILLRYSGSRDSSPSIIPASSAAAVAAAIVLAASVPSTSMTVSSNVTVTVVSTCVESAAERLLHGKQLHSSSSSRRVSAVGPVVVCVTSWTCSIVTCAEESDFESTSESLCRSCEAVSFPRRGSRSCAS
ncbi:hypothetical protein M758_12G157000, partial [Ceratodon purpureus]